MLSNCLPTSELSEAYRLPPKLPGSHALGVATSWFCVRLFSGADVGGAPLAAGCGAGPLGRGAVVGPFRTTTTLRRPAGSLRSSAVSAGGDAVAGAAVDAAGAAPVSAGGMGAVTAGAGLGAVAFPPAPGGPQCTNCPRAKRATAPRATAATLAGRFQRLGGRASNPGKDATMRGSTSSLADADEWVPVPPPSAPTVRARNEP